jgi:very-short-patch-repair endonuclease
MASGLILEPAVITISPVNPTHNARRLRREQTQEEKHLWRALRAGRFAGFKFRRQHPVERYVLDFYCASARLSVELDGFGHGHPNQRERDLEREQSLARKGIEELRFWNHQWRRNPAGVLLEIWQALHRRTGCLEVMRQPGNHRFVPPVAGQIICPPVTPKV